MEMENTSVCWCIKAPCRTHSDGTSTHTHTCSDTHIHVWLTSSRTFSDGFIILPAPIHNTDFWVSVCMCVSVKYRIIFMGNIQIYSWVINCGGALSYSYFMGRKDNNLISFPLCVSPCVCVWVASVYVHARTCMWDQWGHCVFVWSEFAVWRLERQRLIITSFVWLTLLLIATISSVQRALKGHGTYFKVV